MTKDAPDSRWVVLGKVAGLHGVQGWLKIHSWTEPRAQILTYSPWFLQRAGAVVKQDLEIGRQHGKGLIAKLAGVDSRDQAVALLDSRIAVMRTQLPAVSEGEYYWTDLLGLQVVTQEGRVLGKVEHLFETGANDVLVVKGEQEHLLPWLWQQVILAVDLDAGQIRVDWDPEF